MHAHERGNRDTIREFLLNLPFNGKGRFFCSLAGCALCYGIFGERNNSV